MESKPKVSVVMITYNHEKFIKQAIEGVLMQKCSFDVELIIADDCSPDRTEEAVKETIKNHPNKHWVKYTKHSKNKGMNANFIWATEQAKGKYIALCEGDDYWTDPLKLQKQVDFLESNSEFGLVSTQHKNYNQTNGKFTQSETFNEPYKTYTFNEIIIESKIATLTSVFRTSLMLKYLKMYNSNNTVLSGLDYCMWLYFSYKMKVAVLKDITAVYRILPNSASHSSDVRKLWILRKKYYNDFKFYKSYLPNIDPILINNAEYFRAKGYYILAGKSNDVIICEELLQIFKKNKDKIRYTMLNIFMKYPKLFSIAILYEKLSIRLSKKM